ncbi:MAG: potassium-transporting ATPase subunit KdpC [Candidatus Omnitrophica bacterium]|nr:potassium-transporting ATPase subunit KdpC [Candidatus Omnitrophota bacterium]
MLKEQLRPAFISFILLTVVTGVLYPWAITGIAQTFFKDQANGSLIFENGRLAGSELIGQPFDDPQYLWGRLSATSPASFNAAASSGSNFGPMNPDLLKATQVRIKRLQDADPGNKSPVPVDLVTASGSGLDPHISPAAAEYQIPRIASARKLTGEEVRSIIRQHTQNRLFGIIGEPVVNVLKVNLQLDRSKKT